MYVELSVFDKKGSKQKPKPKKTPKIRCALFPIIECPGGKSKKNGSNFLDKIIWKQ